MIVVMLLGMLVAAMAGGLAVASYAERRIATTHVQATTLTYAAESVVHELEAAAASADWATLPSAWLLGVPSVGADLTARTAALNRSLASQLPAGADTPRWRLTGVRVTADHEVVAWVRDDPADGDGNSAIDQNGRVTWRVEVTNLRGDRRVVEVTLQRGDARARRVAWRELT